MNRKIGVILSYVLMVFEVLSTLLLTPFIIRTLGQAEYGVYKLAFAINAYLLASKAVKTILSNKPTIREQIASPKVIRAACPINVR